jgi:hypothetical protein
VTTRVIQGIPKDRSKRPKKTSDCNKKSVFAPNQVFSFENLPEKIAGLNAK